LAGQRRANRLRFNIETKVEADAPEETAPRRQFVERAVHEVARSGFARNVTIQSFDWGALMLTRKLAPQLPLVVLVRQDR
jgi:glycerophosphoryl diester phosphodiesterase